MTDLSNMQKEHEVEILTLKTDFTGQIKALCEKIRAADKRSAEKQAKTSAPKLSLRLYNPK